MTDLLAEVEAELDQGAWCPRTPFRRKPQSITLRVEGGDRARPSFANLAGTGRPGRLEQRADQRLRRTLDDSFDQRGGHDAPESIRLGTVGKCAADDAGLRAVFRNIA